MSGTATLLAQIADDPASKRLTKREKLAYRRRYAKLGMSQNKMARAIGRERGLFGRWCRGLVSSKYIRAEVEKFLEEAEAIRGIKPPKKRA